MPRFSNSSKVALATCHPLLQDLMNEAIRYIDFKVLEGHRGQEAQNKAYRQGYSKLKWPFGKHNKVPSLAVDIAPYPIDWGDKERFVYFAGFIKCLAVIRGVHLRWGGDWDSDTLMKDEQFRDLGHFELLSWPEGTVEK